MEKQVLTAALTALAVGFATTTVAQTPAAQPSIYHPVIDWVDSAETAGETAPNGLPEALVDDDTGRSPAQVSFWTSQWQDGGPGFPHVIVMSAKGSDAVCGIQYTARPTHKTGGFDYTGAEHAPAKYAVYAFDTAPAKPADDEMESWRQQVRTGRFADGVLIKSGGLIASNKAQLIPLPRSTQRSFALVGLAAVDPAKTQMAASDIKLISCSSEDLGHGGGSDDVVRDLYIDQLPFGEPGQPVWFDASEHTYRATAYRHTQSISLRINALDDASVSINGQGPDADGRVNIPLHDGLNVVTASATSGQKKASYAINITKVDTDFRGNVQIPAKVTVNGGSAQDNENMADGAFGTSWISGPPVRSNEWSADVTGFSMDLGQVRQLARISAWGMPEFKKSVQWWHPGSSVSIAIQASDDAPWQTIADRASLRRDAGGLFYWDFNGYHQAKRVRVWLNQITGGEMPAGDVLSSVRFDEVEAWGLPIGSPMPVASEPAPDTTGSSDPGQGLWGTNRAQSLALRNGILLPAWIPSQGYARGAFDGREQQISGGAIPMFYDTPMFDSNVMKRLPHTPWALAKAPAGGNSMSGAKEPYDFLSAEMRPYANKLVDIQFGDEGNYSRAEVREFAKWFSFSKSTYPGAIVHSNQNENPSWGNLANMTEYVRTAKPDLLSWDTYYFGGGGVFGSHGPKTPSKVVSELLNSNMWKVQRQVALEGLDGTGGTPILFGQYLDYSFDVNVSESQKAITPMLSLATGMKWFGLFRMEYNGYDFGSLFDHDGAPTRAFYEYARVFTDIKTMGRYLVGFNNRYVAIKPGSYDGHQTRAPKGWRMDNFDAPETASVNTEFGIAGITAQNVGTVNPGKPGDVVLGYFDKLPGLSDDKAREIFGTVNPKGIMVVNGLVGTTKLPSTGLAVRTDDGAYWQTTQHITLTLSKPSPDAQLISVNPKTGTAEPLALQRSADGQHTVTLTLGGGQGQLLYWSTR